MKARILNLYSNERDASSSLKCDHGESFLITIGDEQILFDVGAKGPILLHNMNELGVNPNAISKLVLSHGHFDHTLALPHFLDKRTGNAPLPVYAHPDVREEKIARMLFFTKPLGFPHLNPNQEKKIAFELSAEPQQVTPSLTTTGEIHERPEKDGVDPMAFHREENRWCIDPVRDDISLLLNTDEGAVIIVGCAHAGILNICRRVKELTDDPIKAIIGGSHMVRFTEAEVLHVAMQLKDAFDYPDLYLNHCTDKLPVPFVRKTKAIDILKKHYGAPKVHHCRVGNTVEFAVVQ